MGIKQSYHAALLDFQRVIGLNRSNSDSKMSHFVGDCDAQKNVSTDLQNIGL